MKDNKKSRLTTLCSIGIILFVVSLFLQAGSSTGSASFMIAMLRVSKVLRTVGFFLFFASIICLAVKNGTKEANKNANETTNHKGIDKTKTYLTAEFVSAHKGENLKYSINFEYTDLDNIDKLGSSKFIYTYDEAKYFQKTKRFTICLGGTEPYISDIPRPGIIPSLTNAPIVPKEKIKAPEDKTKEKQVDEETDFVRNFCPYCDCMLKPKARKCSNCGAPVKKY